MVETPNPAAPDMTCKELVEVVTEYLEGTLGAGDRVRFEAHLNTCRHCSLYLEQMRQTIRAAGRLHEEDIPSRVKDALLKAFRRWKGS